MDLDLVMGLIISYFAHPYSWLTCKNICFQDEIDSNIKNNKESVFSIIISL
jgi:hypothetical protein